MTHEQFLRVSQVELGKQTDELRSTHEAAIRNQDWQIARFAQLRLWSLMTDRINLECALEDLKAAQS